METTRNNNGVLILIILAAFLACGWMLLRNGHHADLRHNEAPALRSVINDSAKAEGNGYRTGLSLYYSELHGTLLILLRSGDGKAGGWVIKITEATPAGIQALYHRTYERTCFVADEVYWSAVIARDRYMPLAISLSIPALTGVLIAALAVVVRRLRADGHNAIADRIEREVKGH